MGIKGLSQFLRNKFPEVFESVHISEYEFKKIAVDVSLYVHIYISQYNDPEKPDLKTWLIGILRLVAMLRKYEVHPCFVYDTSAPKEKDDERARRREVKEKSKDRLFVIEDALEEYNNTGEISQTIIDFQKKRKIPQSLLGGLNLPAIEYAIKKMKKQHYEVKPEDFALTKELFKILDIPYLLSPAEGETLCSDLCVQGKVDAVLSEDTDSLAYGTPVFLTKIDTKNGTCVRIRHERLLELMELTQDQFLDFAIMCGTDYNKNIPRIGPVKAYTLIKKYGSIEAIEKTGIDVSILNHKVTRQLFKNYPRCKEKVSYVGIPNFQALTDFLKENNIKIDLQFLYESFVREIVIEGDENKEDENEEENLKEIEDENEEENLKEVEDENEEENLKEVEHLEEDS